MWFRVYMRARGGAVRPQHHTTYTIIDLYQTTQPTLRNVEFVVFSYVDQLWKGLWILGLNTNCWCLILGLLICLKIQCVWPPKSCSYYCHISRPCNLKLMVTVKVVCVCCVSVVQKTCIKFARMIALSRITKLTVHTSFAKLCHCINQISTSSQLPYLSYTLR